MVSTVCLLIRALHACNITVHTFCIKKAYFYSGASCGEVATRNGYVRRYPGARSESAVFWPHLADQSGESFTARFNLEHLMPNQAYRLCVDEDGSVLMKGFVDSGFQVTVTPGTSTQTARISLFY